jgi:AcrR family transcriptional regulator
MLDAAVTVFSRRGYHQASMDEIAELAGISKPMVYAYLGAKDDLFAACIRREADRMMSAIAGEARGDLPPDEQLWRALRAFFGFVEQHRDSWVMLHRQARGEGGLLATELDSVRERIVDLVGYLLGRSAQGAKGTEADLRAFAYALVGAAESLAAYQLDHPEEHPEVTAARLMNLAWVGFRDLLAGTVWRPSR